MRRLHVKRFLLILAVLVLVCGSAYALNRTQVRRQAGVLLQRAEQAEKDAAGNPEKRDEAVDLYEQYLKFRPRDEHASVQYIRLIANTEELDLGKLGKMADTMHKFFRDFPNHPEERKIFVKILYNKASLSSARENLAILLADPRYADDLDVLEDAVKVEEADERKFAEALAYVDKAIASGRDPARIVKFYARSLALLKMLNQDTKAVARTEELQKPPYGDRRDARVVLIRYFIASQDYDAARDQAKIARELPGGDSDPEVLLASAEVQVADREPNLGAAQEFLEKSFALDPKRIATGALLSEVYIRLGQREKAIEVLAKVTDSLTAVKEDFYAALDKLIDLKDVEVSEKLMARMNKDNTREYVMQYFRGRLELVKGNWPKAKADLEACAPFLSRLPQYHKKLRCDLGECYHLSHNPDQMLESYNAALADDRKYYPALLGKAEALVKLGRFRDAIPIYDDLAREVKALQITLARLVLLEILSQPESNRNWAAFEKALGQPPYSTDLMLLKAEALSIRNEKVQSRQLLQDAAALDPKDPRIPLKAIRLGASGGKVSSEDAARLIEEAEKLTGDSVDFRLAKVSILMSRSKKPSVAELQTIGTVPPDSKWPKPELFRLWFGLGEIANRQQDAVMKQAALDFFRKAAELQPLDLIVRALIIDIALSLNQDAVCEKALHELGDADGLDGPIYNLGRIAVRLKSYKPGDKDTLKELRKRAEAIQKVRPAWSRAYLALAQIDELEGLNDQALSNLRKAIELGDKQEAVIRKVIDLLRERRLYDDARVLLDKLHFETGGILPEDLLRFRAIMHLLTTDVMAQDVREIDQFAPADAPTYELQLLRGTLLSALREDQGAEKAFRKALEKVPTERPGSAPLEAWSALVSLMVRTDRRDIARQAVEEAERKLRTTPPKVENLKTLAEINETIGDIPGAEKFRQEIVKLTPNELDGHKNLIWFLQRTGRLPEAEQLMRTLIENPSESIARWCRRHLAISLMMKRDAYQSQSYALGLVDQNLKKFKDDPEDRKARAIVLCANPAQRDEGIKTLAEYGFRFELTPDEYYFLTRLYFDQGRFHDAEEALKLAIRYRPNVSLEHLAGAVWLYLSMNRVDKALETVNRLKAVAPRSWEAVREEARVLARTGNTAAARDLILKYPPALTDAFVPTRTGPMLEEIKCYPEAEQLYTKFLETSKIPGAHLPLAAFYITQKQTDRAIDLAQKYADQTHVVVTGRVMSGAVRAKLPAPDKVNAVETWITRKMAENKDKVEVYAALLGNLAEVRDAQGRYDEAIAAYENALRFGDSDLVINNLAMLKALHQPGKADEAKVMMDKLIGIRGPDPTFLDTRAVCSLVQGEDKPAEAVKDLKLALAQKQRAVYYFHLMWAHDLQRDEKNRKAARLEALQLGLKPEDLHPKELPKYQDLLGRE